MGCHGTPNQAGVADAPPVRRVFRVPHLRPGAGPWRATDTRQAAGLAPRFQHLPNRDDDDGPGHHPEGIAWKVRQTTLSENISRTARSEEHTSELQSLMRISYAVFCLKKKKKK